MSDVSEEGLRLTGFNIPDNFKEHHRIEVLFEDGDVQHKLHVDLLLLISLSKDALVSDIQKHIESNDHGNSKKTHQTT